MADTAAFAFTMKSSSKSSAIAMRLPSDSAAFTISEYIRQEFRRVKENSSSGVKYEETNISLRSMSGAMEPHV